MRGFVLTLGASVMIAMTAPALAGEVYVIETSQGSKPIAVKKDTSALAAVPTMADGKANQGFSYAALYELPGAGSIFISASTEFKGPIRIGDTVITTCAVKELREGRRVVMDCLCEVNGKVVVTGEGLVMAPKKPASLTSAGA